VARTYAGSGEKGKQRGGEGERDGDGIASRRATGEMEGWGRWQR
jgi:hypothetical protein